MEARVDQMFGMIQMAIAEQSKIYSERFLKMAMTLQHLVPQGVRTEHQWNCCGLERKWTVLHQYIREE